MRQNFRILMADDDEDDFLILSSAFREIPFDVDLSLVENGEDLLDYLWRRGPYLEPDSSPKPDLILLDLNMHRKDGREALKEIKSDPATRHIPVIVFSTSTKLEDVVTCYAEGANAYLVKPIEFARLVEMMRALTVFWFETAVLPSHQLEPGQPLIEASCLTRQ